MRQAIPPARRPRHLVMVGYRGAGKSSVGKILAKILGLDYVDTDIAIQEKSGHSIREIFEKAGEAHFRDMETAILEETLEQMQQIAPSVIATGGGMVMRQENRRILKLLGPVIWLKVSPELAIDRILSDRLTGDQRPALTDQNFSEEVRAMIAWRNPYYAACSDKTIDNDRSGVSTEKIADQIVGQLRQSLWYSDLMARIDA
jgi:shikimate kinase